MGAYKRPLKDGEVCEDSRVAFNPNLGKAKAIPVEVKPVEPQAKASKKAKEIEVAVDEATETVEQPTIDVDPVEAAE